ncbi:GrpB family protein [Clostridium beijerinckii]|uniref:GrpB family protein n=1 Tax=Clostridium beijerinckii TaxID=1520 RepID=UPI0022E36DEA|nr:GrpB family protein [Clostridium beijerinckii]
MIGLRQDEVVLSLSEPEYWNEAFKEEKQKLEVLLQGQYIAIEHVGSTAISGIMAKPIIDIAIGIKDFENIDIIKDLMIKGGYEYRSSNSSDERVLFIKVIDSKRTHHLHIEQYLGESWSNHVNFRDSLLHNTNLREEYMKLKIILAQKYPNDRKKYTSEKAEFIQLVLSSDISKSDKG